MVFTNDCLISFRFYWELGRDIVLLSEEASYGSSFYKAISTYLKEEFPDIKSFSTTNLKYMRYFYEIYPSVPENRQQLVDDLEEIFRKYIEEGISSESISISFFQHLSIPSCHSPLLIFST